MEPTPEQVEAVAHVLAERFDGVTLRDPSDPVDVSRIHREIADDVLAALSAAEKEREGEKCSTVDHEAIPASRYVSCEGEGSHPYCPECVRVLLRAGEIDRGSVKGREGEAEGIERAHQMLGLYFAYAPDHVTERVQRAMHSPEGLAPDLHKAREGDVIEKLREWIGEQELHDNTGHDFDKGFMLALAELGRFLNDLQEQSTPKEEK